MSASNGVAAPSAGRASRLAGLAMNIRAAFAMFMRAPRPPGRLPAWPPHGRLALGALAAILALVLVVVVFDASSVAGARRLPAGWIIVFKHVTDFGKSGWFLFPLGAFLLTIAAVSQPPLPAFSRRVLAALSFRLGFIFLAIAVPGLFVAIVKRLIGRARPFVAGEDAWTSLHFVWRADYASFPSGHATTAFAAAVAIGAVWPKARPVMWAYAIAIGVSRVIVTAHHPSDVIAGAICGAIGALLVRNWYASRRLGFTVDASGGVRRLPGPSCRRIKAVARRLLPA